MAFLIVTPVAYNAAAAQAKFYKLIRLKLELSPGSVQAIAADEPIGGAWQPIGDAVKLRISQTGIHRVTAGVLRRAGFRTSVDPHRLAIFHRGAEVPIFVSGEEDGAFNTADFVEFASTTNDKPYCTESVYWLVAGRSRGCAWRRLTQRLKQMPFPLRSRRRRLCLTAPAR